MDARRTRMRVALLIGIMNLAVPGPAQDQQMIRGRRRALVIGNNAYPWGRLKNSVHDARDLAALLPRLGFDRHDIVLATDTTLSQMQRAASEFVQRLRPDDVALAYYSGHGVEVRGENYLVPVDFPANATELEARDEAYSAQKLLRSLEATRARVRILILDACRDNQLRATRSSGGGLVRMDGNGTLIVFATGAGSTADDNPRGGNGLFTAHLLHALPTPGVPVEQLLKQVAREVYGESDSRQMPAVYGMLLEDFVLVPGAAPAQPPAKAPSLDPELAAWRSVENSTSPDLLERFLREFPAGKYADMARTRLSTLRNSPEGVTPTETRPTQCPASIGVSTITGSARGVDGKPLAAIIKIARLDCAGVYFVRTDQQRGGQFFYGGLPVAVYRVSLMVNGNALRTLDNVRTVAGEASVRDFDLSSVEQPRD